MAQLNIIAVVGSYHRGGIIDQAVDAALESAQQRGATTQKLFLLDHPIEFCHNCRSCTQASGESRGDCVINDGMAALLDAIDAADGLILASPVNIGDVTALTRRFFERMVCYTYWPWEQPAPKPRAKRITKPAVLITSTAMPRFMARFLTRSMATLRQMARMFGAKSIGELYIGLAAQTQDQQLTEKEQQRAKSLGERLIRRQ